MPRPTRLPRKPTAARKAAEAAWPYRCCVICGLQLDALDIAHLDNDPGNDDPDNLAWLCKTHHWMVDGDLYPIAAIKLMRDHWQLTQGKLDHSGRMKDAGPKAAATRKARAAGRKAAATRKAKASREG